MRPSIGHAAPLFKAADHQGRGRDMIDLDYLGFIAFLAVVVCLATCGEFAERDCRVKVVQSGKSASDAEAVCK